MVKILGIIQVRMSSSRLPAKAMLDLAGKPLLIRVIESVNRAASLKSLVVATSTQDEDEIIVELCKRAHIPCARGSLENVLERFYEVAKNYKAEHVVRITADNPLTSPRLIDELIKRYFEDDCDYARFKNLPYGSGAEVFKFSSLEFAFKNTKDPDHLEHVTPFIIRHSNSKEYEVGCYYAYPECRVTVDTYDDYIRISKFYNFCQKRGINADLRSYIEYVQNKTSVT